MAGRGRVGAALVGVVALTAAGLVVARGAQADGPDPSAGTAPPGVVGGLVEGVSAGLLRTDGLTDALGDRAVGRYLDDAGDVVVSVSDQAAVDLVRSAGAVPRLVRYTLDQLLVVRRDLDRQAARSGAGRVRSWYVDPVTGTVVVTRPAGAPDAATQRFLRRAGAFGDRVTLRESAGTPVTTADDFGLRGGLQVDKNTGYTCSLGFNARAADGSRLFLTAGHCTSGRPSFSRNGYILGETRSSSFPENDYGSVKVIDGWDQRGEVERWADQDVTLRGTAPAVVGSTVCKSGKTTHWSCGRVVATGVTVNYGGNRIVRGLYQHTACVRTGDSGGANLSGEYAVGITSGAALIDGNCLHKYGRPNESYSQPIGEALAGTGASLVLG